MEPRQKLIGRRQDTLKAMFLLVLARFMVRFVPLSWWKSSLGFAQDKASVAKSEVPPEFNDIAGYWARRVFRATERLPGETKCLPQAVALQWLLARRRLSTQLVIAMHRSSGGGEKDRLHAWVESYGTLLIGHCERDDYSPIAIFSST